MRRRDRLARSGGSAAPNPRAERSGGRRCRTCPRELRRRRDGPGQVPPESTPFPAPARGPRGLPGLPGRAAPGLPGRDPPGRLEHRRSRRRAEPRFEPQGTVHSELQGGAGGSQEQDTPSFVCTRVGVSTLHRTRSESTQMPAEGLANQCSRTLCGEIPSGSLQRAVPCFALNGHRRGGVYRGRKLCTVAKATCTVAKATCKALSILARQAPPCLA
ncbi:uncharacterized protein LOC123652350 isoform X2 [Pipistrellus kuhlii]|uniref:uncharacterized protein LOC123652350 isoform X2 n=1 Tax=Pipistrellus kuhlii TaxID=59472 RepID=UPI001E26FABA|nr:uncharacterized protein LOC123652350 isoform X2 [Pipistrellus kuhlii]